MWWCTKFRLLPLIYCCWKSRHIHPKLDKKKVFVSLKYMCIFYDENRKIILHFCRKNKFKCLCLDQRKCVKRVLIEYLMYKVRFCNVNIYTWHRNNWYISSIHVIILSWSTTLFSITAIKLIRLCSTPIILKIKCKNNLQLCWIFVILKTWIMKLFCWHY